jgi:hypothetical protein
MLAAGMRHVEIARELELSPWTIANIARAARREEEFLAEGQTIEDDAPPGYEAKNLRRCPECGGMVYLWPCLACRGAMVGAVGEDEPDEVCEDAPGFIEALTLEF